MSDRELLLERLGRLAIVLDELMPQCAELVRDALAMLKEREEEIENLKQTAQSMMEGVCLLKEQMIVCCKDCKFQVNRGRRYPECDKHFLLAKDNWFCADVERKDT